jgi:SAM-dependent methyltransferase
MPGVHNLFHPIRSTRSLYRLVSMAVHQRIGARQLRQIRRGSVDRCWCGGELKPFKWHESFAVCARCTTYVNRRPPLREELDRLYSLDFFWRARQKQKGIPTIESRSELYRTDGRLDQWLSLVSQYGPKSGTVIEVGCAPGALLCELRDRGFSCVGVEISEDVTRWLRDTKQLDVRSGFFPGVELPVADMFLAFDVLEHSPCPVEFLKDASKHLKPGGIAVIQTPIDRYDFSPPFGRRFDLFDDVEHMFLFTDRGLEALAESAGMDIVSLKENLWLGGEVCVFKTRPVASPN